MLGSSKNNFVSLVSAKTDRAGFGIRTKLEEVIMTFTQNMQNYFAPIAL